MTTLGLIVDKIFKLSRIPRRILQTERKKFTLKRELAATSSYLKLFRWKYRLFLRPPPTKVTSYDCSRSSLPRASAGKTCPPVPPVVITILLLGFNIFLLVGDI